MGAWHPPKFWSSPPAPADFEVLYANCHPQSSFYVTSGTLNFKFLTQALIVVWELKKYIVKTQLLKNMNARSKKILFYRVLSSPLMVHNESPQYDSSRNRKSWLLEFFVKWQFIHAYVLFCFVLALDRNLCVQLWKRNWSFTLISWMFANTETIFPL